jgi:hypothetical protein
MEETQAETEDNLRHMPDTFIGTDDSPCEINYLGQSGFSVPDEGRITIMPKFSTESIKSLQATGKQQRPSAGSEDSKQTIKAKRK